MTTNINTILSWFKTRSKPTQEQFHATWSSFWHKDEEIPQNSISDLTTTLDTKADQSKLEAHTTDDNAHAAAFEKKLDAGGYQGTAQDLKSTIDGFDKLDRGEYIGTAKKIDDDRIAADLLKEDSSNKSNSVSDLSSTSKFPVWKVITDWAISLFQTIPTSVINENVSGNYNLDFSKDTWILTLTSTTTFTQSNLPASGKTKVISLYVTGNYALTYPAEWTGKIIGNYIGTLNNQIVVEYLASGNYWVTITQPD